MADRNFEIFDNLQVKVLGKLEEQADGTYAKVVKNVGSGVGKLVTVTPTITAGVYHANDCIGGKMELADAVRTAGNSSLLVSLVVVDKGNIKTPLEILFFNADPSLATLTDNAAIVLSTDVSKICGRASIYLTDWATIGGVGVAVCTLGLEMLQAVGTDLYAAAMVTGTPTFLSTSDLIFLFGFDLY